MNRHLYRSRTDRRIAGVAAGVAEFFDLDPTLVRLVWFFSIFFGGLTFALYLGMWLIVPLEPISADSIGADGTTAGHRHVHLGTGRLTTVLGLGLILVGAVALFDVVVPGAASWRYFWPLLFLGAGALLMGGAVRRGEPEQTQHQESLDQ